MRVWRVTSWAGTFETSVTLQPPLEDERDPVIPEKSAEFT
jgi:hypothetical protein